MNKLHASLIGIMAASVSAACYGCGDESVSGGGDELASVEDGIAALNATNQAAQDEAKACFDAFKTCQESATAGDSACRDQLKTCLPDAPPAIPGCGPRGDGGTRADAGVLPAPTPISRDGGDARGRDGGASHEGPGRGGPGQGGAGFGPDSDRGRADGEHGMCGGHFDFPNGALGGCRDEADRSMRGGTGCDRAREQHGSCMAHSFDDSLAKLCEKATKLCAQPDAQADVCQRLSSACASSDAGTPPARPDAGARPARPDAGPRPARPDAGN